MSLNQISSYKTHTGMMSHSACSHRLAVVRSSGLTISFTVWYCTSADIRWSRDHGLATWPAIFLNLARPTFYLAGRWVGQLLPFLSPSSNHGGN